MWAIINTKSAFDIYLPILFSFIRFKLLQNSQYSYPQQHRTHHFITNMMKSNQFCKNVIFQEFHPLQHPVYYQVNKEMKLLRFVMGKKENLFLLTLLELIKLMICKWRSGGINFIIVNPFTGSSCLMRISLLRISLLRFFNTKIWLMRFYGLFILLLST